MTVLILEDETILAISMEEFLEDLGYEVVHFVNAEDAFDAIYDRGFDLLLLDVRVSGQMNGFKLLSTLRENNILTPAIFITSLNNIEDLTQGYKCGCCDYIRKPFDLAELKLRIEHVVQTQCFKASDNIIELEFSYKYDTKKMELSLGDKKVILSKRETSILELLIKHRGSVVSYEMFWEEVWGEWIDPTNIRVQVGTLRKKLEQNFIKNIRAVGYSIDI
jgi:DNA-binding response OmpR family regulator